MFEFEKQSSTYCVEIPEDRFEYLLDSETYVTDCKALQPGESTLSEKLEKLPGVFRVEYDGHFGSAIHFSISAEEDNDFNRMKISEAIEEHLVWCESIEKV